MRFLLCLAAFVIGLVVTVFAIDTNTVHTVQGIADKLAPQYKTTIDAVSVLIIMTWSAVVAIISFIRGHFHGKASVTLPKA